jgi:hypothetical protein
MKFHSQILNNTCHFDNCQIILAFHPHHTNSSQRVTLEDFDHDKAMFRTFRKPFEASCTDRLQRGVSKSFRTGRLERELQMVHPSATRCSCIAILWASLASFDAITLRAASERVFIDLFFFVMCPVRILLDKPSYSKIFVVLLSHFSKDRISPLKETTIASFSHPPSHSTLHNQCRLESAEQYPISNKIQKSVKIVQPYFTPRCIILTFSLFVCLFVCFFISFCCSFPPRCCIHVQTLASAHISTWFNNGDPAQKVKQSTFIKVKLSLCRENELGESSYSSTYSLTSAPSGGEWSASRPGRFTTRERAPGTHWIGGPRASLDTVVKIKIPGPFQDSNHQSSGP